MCWITSNVLLYWDNNYMVVLYFLTMVYYIYWFLAVKLTLYFWNKSCFVMLYNSFIYFCIWIASILLLEVLLLPFSSFPSLLLSLPCLHFFLLLSHFPTNQCINVENLEQRAVKKTISSLGPNYKLLNQCMLGKEGKRREKERVVVNSDILK